MPRNILKIGLVTVALVFLAPAFVPPASPAILREPSADGGSTCDRSAGQSCTFVMICDGGPGNPCTADEVAQLQALFTPTPEVQRGDTVKIQAGVILPLTQRISIGAIPGTEGYLTITTTEADALPEPGTRITLSYLHLMPVFEIQTAKDAAMGLKGQENDVAEHVRIRGLAFRPMTGVNAIMYWGLLRIGFAANREWGYCDGCSPDIPFLDVNWQPDDIIVEQCIFYQEKYSENVQVAISLHGRQVVIRDNHIDGGQVLGGEGKAISGINGPGPWTIENNYLSASGSNVFFGGARPSTGTTPSDLTIRYNLITKPEARYRLRRWEPGMYVMAGSVVVARTQPPGCTNCTYIADNSGYTGDYEPAWPGSSPCSPLPGCRQVYDGSVLWTWKSAISARWTVKNLYEHKTGLNILTEFNVFENNWVDGQVSPIIFKSPNQCMTAVGSLKSVRREGYATVSGTRVLWAGGGKLPMIPASLPRVDPNVFKIFINGIERTIAPNGFISEEELEITEDLGTIATPVPFRHGNPTGYDPADTTYRCYESKTRNLVFRNNIVRNAPTAFSLELDENSNINNLRDITIENNLFYNIDGLQWRDLRFEGHARKADMAIGGPVPGLILRHNSILSTNTHKTYGALNKITSHDSIVVDNIFMRGTGGFTADGTREGTATLEKTFCGGQPCPPWQWNRNIVAGASASQYYGDERTITFCPSPATGCSEPEFAPHLEDLFLDRSRNQYQIKDLSSLKRSASDGKDIGVDDEELPQIRNLAVETTSGQALFTFELGKQIEHIPCVIEVSEQRDFTTTVPDLDPALFWRPNTDRGESAAVQERRRIMVVGSRVPLAPSTTYWYRLQCGGDAASGSLTTREPRTGTDEVTVSHTPPGDVAGWLVEFGYQQSNGSIVDAQRSEPASCGFDSCTISIEPEAGRILYYQIRYLDAAQNIIEDRKGPLQTVALIGKPW